MNHSQTTKEQHEEKLLSCIDIPYFKNNPAYIELWRSYYREFKDPQVLFLMYFKQISTYFHWIHIELSQHFLRRGQIQLAHFVLQEALQNKVYDEERVKDALSKLPPFVKKYSRGDMLAALNMKNIKCFGSVWNPYSEQVFYRDNLSKEFCTFEHMKIVGYEEKYATEPVDQENPIPKNETLAGEAHLQNLNLNNDENLSNNQGNSSKQEEVVSETSNKESIVNLQPNSGTSEENCAPKQGNSNEPELLSTNCENNSGNEGVPSYKETSDNICDNQADLLNMAQLLDQPIDKLLEENTEPSTKNTPASNLEDPNNLLIVGNNKTRTEVNKDREELSVEPDADSHNARPQPSVDHDLSTIVESETQITLTFDLPDGICAKKPKFSSSIFDPVTLEISGALEHGSELIIDGYIYFVQSVEKNGFNLLRIAKVEDVTQTMMGKSFLLVRSDLESIRLAKDIFEYSICHQENSYFVLYDFAPICSLSSFIKDSTMSVKAFYLKQIIEKLILLQNHSAMLNGQYDFFIDEEFRVGFGSFILCESVSGSVNLCFKEFFSEFDCAISQEFISTLETLLHTVEAKREIFKHKTQLLQTL